MKKSFLNSKAPFITEMVQTPTVSTAVSSIRSAIADGATAIGFQMGSLEKEYRTEENLCRIFSSAGDAPIYFTNYRKGLNEGISDSELMDGLMLGLKCGATMVDVMGDAFSPAPEELTTDESAIKKQMQFIERVHKEGGEVLMSSHVYQFRPAERVLEMAIEQERRGADMVKIVTGGESEEEEMINLEICALLKRELRVPFLFLSSGQHSYLHRTVGPALGVSMWLCFREYNETTYEGPPLLRDVIKIKEGLKI